MLNYQAIEIFTNEGALSGNKRLVDSVIQYIRDLRIAARCIVTRGIAGCYESGEMATKRLEILSYNLPVRIYIVLPARESKRVLDGLNGMIDEGIIALHGLNVLNHRVRNAFFPRRLMVGDVMTMNPKSVGASSPLNDATNLLLSSIFTGLPVVDGQNRPIGVITQGDLIRKGGMPLRLGLLEESGQDRRESVLSRLALRKAFEIMTTPVVSIADDRPLTEAVDLMLSRDVKRLPVVDSSGSLIGMLSRLDIFRTVMREAPDWKTFRAQNIEVKHLKCVKDVLRRDTHTVSPETPIDKVIRVIDENDIQRVVVVNPEGKLLGLISDRDLLHYFKQEQQGIWHMLSKVKHGSAQDACKSNLGKCLAKITAGAVMNTNLITVSEDMLIEEAIGLMMEQALKRLPVVDESGRFKGMISRDSLLRTGFGNSEVNDP
jgi:CBS domain-containing protein